MEEATSGYMVVLPPDDDLQFRNLQGIASGEFSLHEPTVRALADWACKKIQGEAEERAAYEEVVVRHIQYKNAKDGKLTDHPPSHYQHLLNEAVRNAWKVHKRHPGEICKEQA